MAHMLNASQFIIDPVGLRCSGTERICPEKEAKVLGHLGTGIYYGGAVGDL